MDAQGVSDDEADRALAWSWTALGVGMLAGTLHLPVSYALVKWSCATNQRTALILLALGAFVVTAAATWLAWACQSRLRARVVATGEARADRTLFVAELAFGTDAILALFIAASTAGPLVLSPCA